LNLRSFRLRFSAWMNSLSDEGIEKSRSEGDGGIEFEIRDPG